MEKAVVLFSGGLDSAVTLACAVRAKCDPFPLCFDYGQTNRKEIAHAKWLIKNHFKLKRDLLVCNISGYADLAPQCVMLGKPGKPSQFAKAKHITVPNRLVVFLSLAGAYAVSVGAHIIYTGIQNDSALKQPIHDADSGICEQMAWLMSWSALPQRFNMRVRAPLISMSKEKIYRRALRWGIPVQRTWTCLQGGDEPCGKCTACVPLQKVT